MLATLLSATLHGIAGRVVRVEVDVAPGLPGFTIVGLPDAALSEARERVRGALRNAGFHHPPRRITVNLAPAELRKAGASLDLAIALGILLGSEQVRVAPGRVALIGELGLGGEVRRGARGSCRWASRSPRRGVPAGASFPPRRVEEARLVAGHRALSASATWRERRGAAFAARTPRRRRGRGRVPRAIGSGGRRGRGGQPRRPARRPPSRSSTSRTSAARRVARRALEIALAGGHAMLLVGPPGAGKTLLARTIPGLLPDLDDEAALAATVVASVAGERARSEALVRRPPGARAPPHDVATPGWSAAGRGCRPAR